ncbi:hypothetical protein TTHERM_00526780 (macronuclear) [Tetrahymena thermophila SB210]|uniref:Uncharacterized protein n=1 Tax=Tetrahymena thermophila (strain SB210) TaxID=312017 RepID=I7LY76_TETTS|nr:hypothetical protein TTHERM_00526780 [Tetrahymena thermophila SB210]EAS07847.1 hypothetical protein TTHERM_00526780 [Tetrahymena thermophila SB210]|eukprot:XP_001028089.1 hypothetical protein TTHERM_00526780 [Tetrahymena thermophila SB210]
MLLEFNLDFPSSNYSVAYHSSYYNQNTNQLIAIWKVSKKGDIGLCVISSGQAQKEINLAGSPQVRNCVIGRDWNWGEDYESIQEQQIPQITNGFTRVN